MSTPFLSLLMILFYVWFHVMEAKMYGERLQEINAHGPQLTWKPKHNNVFGNRDETEIKRFMGIHHQRRTMAMQVGGKPRHTVRPPTNTHQGRGQFGSGRGRWRDSNRYQPNYWELGSNRRGFGSWGNNGKWNWGSHSHENRGGGGGWNNNNNGGWNHNNAGGGGGGWNHNNGGRQSSGHNMGRDNWNGNNGNQHGGFGGRGGWNGGEHFDTHNGGNNWNRGGFGSHSHGDGFEHGRSKRGNQLPQNFDWRDYTDCQSLDDIRFQECGDCWSVASASVMSDRYCLWTHRNKIFSARQLTTCVYPTDGGCDGGWPKDAMEMYKSKGVASGGDPTVTDERKGCLPYPWELDNNAKCPSSCDNNSPLDSSTAGDFYEITSKNVTEIMEEIYNYGPVVTIFEVFDDFGYMGEGVYQHVSGGSQGYHAVRLIGWGVQNNVPYWLAANSWGNDWGDKGYFKILKGSNHCDVESWVTCVYPIEAYR